MHNPTRTILNLIPSVVGAAFWSFIYFVKVDVPVSDIWIGLYILSLSPYIVCVVLAFVNGHPYNALVGSLAALVGDAFTYHSVFIAPSSSTAGLGMLAGPMANICFFVPGAVIALNLVQRRINSRKA